MTSAKEKILVGYAAVTTMLIAVNLLAFHSGLYLY
jgi:hypothetical protein